ncbi:exonuclease 3'-5' domain containing 3 [Homo sapiens]|uniref:Isoform 5 of Exonuclease mut-7 homolog n=1 Tax=Homo sapiens TaxID=9606 RepID=Q8N9H8-5|nr:exonuclease 3'-5' domain containing 3 [Homo sapiens]KAI4009305.1 exonuclease 3'-5' domain containing 3 [Homo sapiens]
MDPGDPAGDPAAGERHRMGTHRLLQPLLHLSRVGCFQSATPQLAGPLEQPRRPLEH